MDDDVRERIYSVPVMIGGAGLVAVLAAIVTAVVVVSQSSADAVPRRAPLAVPAPTTAFARPAAPAPAPAPAPPDDGKAMFGDLPPMPVVGQLLAP